jgi:mannose-6-phosphate isomerase
MRESSYDKFPFVAVPGTVHECAIGWEKIAAALRLATAKNRTEKPILVVDCYPGVDELAVLNELQSRLAPKLTIRAAEAYHPPERIDKLVAPFANPEEPGVDYSSRLPLVRFFDAEPLWRLRRTIDELKEGLVLIVGCGASLIAWGNILVYAGLARREARQRFCRNETGNLGADNKSVPANQKTKRAHFVDWPVVDRWKRPLLKRWDYVLDTNQSSEPKLANAEDVRRGLQSATQRPFRVVPTRDPEREAINAVYCLDCVLEENSLLLGFGDVRIEVPAIDLLFYQPHALLGEAVYVRFKREFPSRFGFLNPMAGLFEPLAHGDGWREERASLHAHPFELRRHWFSKTVAHDTQDGVNVLNIFEGEEAAVESPGHAFEPFVVHGAETFIVPAAVGRYNIRPHGSSAGKEIATIKVFVRAQDVSNRIQ